MKAMRKVIAMLLLLAMAVSVFSACGSICFNHVDVNHDGACDNCESVMEIVHDDADGNHICDGCGVCLQHVDSKHVGECDNCGADMDIVHNDADTNGLCDGCGACMGHKDENHDGFCDACEAATTFKHEDANNDGVCDGCLECISHRDANNDNICDNCDEEIVPECDVHTDGDHNGRCDVCKAVVDVVHEDADHSGRCDTCNAKMDVVHEDSQHDGKCDVCDAPVRVKHEDLDGDNRCDVCDEWTGAYKPNFDVPAVGYDGSEVTLKFYHTMGENLRNVLDIYIAEFNKLYPNIHIDHAQTGGYDDVRDQISNEITTGLQPNIAYCYPDHVALYNSSKAVTTLDNLIDSKIEITRADGSTEILGLTKEQKADFIQGYYNEGKAYGDDLMYTMPLSKSTEVLYYNKTFFDQHGLTLPTTWDEMEALVQQIKAIDPNCIPLGYDSEANWFITMCEQLGSPYTSATGDHFLFNNDTNKEFVKKFRTWYQNGWMTTQEIYGSYTSGLFVNQDASKPKSYMSIGSSAGATHQRPSMVDGAYPFEVGIATIPQVDPSNPKVISQGPSLCIFQKANPQEVVASWLFVKYLTTTVEFQAEFSIVSGYIPVLKSVMDNPIYAEFINGADGGQYIAALSTKIALEQESAYYVSPAFNGSSKARDEVGQLLIACFGAKSDAEIDAAFSKAVYNCNYFIGNA